MPQDTLPGMPDVDLSPEQEAAVKAIISRESVFLSGPAGSGKNTTLCACINYLEADGVRTGRCSLSALAASRIGGTTIHGFFKLPIDGAIRQGAMAVPDISRLMETDVLIVNYVNTCSALLIDIIWTALDMARQKGHHVQVVFSGDILTLGPVMDRKLMAAYEGILGHEVRGASPIYASHWADLDLKAICLTQDLRGRDPAFFQALNELRIGDGNGLNRLRMLSSTVPLKDGVWVCATREEVRKKNAECLSALDARGCFFNAVFSADANPESFPSPSQLCLKEGAPILMTANIPEKGLTSGMRGHVARINGQKVYAVFPGRRGRILIPQHRWTDEAGEWFCQLPVDLGFAVTVYKARYMHLDAVNADRPSQIPGFVYTLASRVQDPKKLYIGFPLSDKNLRVDSAVCRWHQLNVLQALPKAGSLPDDISAIPYMTRGGMRFGLLSFKASRDITRSFICLRAAGGIACGVFDLQGYLAPVKKKRDVHCDIGDNAYYIVMFLNFVMVDSPERVDCIGDITPKLIRDFLNAYSMGLYGRPGTSHTSGTIDKCISVVFRFLTDLASDANASVRLSYTMADLIAGRYRWSARQGVQEKLEMAFEVLYDPEDHVTVRDMPPAAAQEMLAIAYQRHPWILMNLALGLCGGLRPSETCALSLDSIKIGRLGGKVRQIDIDLENTVRLRSDGVPTGEVKRPRIVTIPSLFLDLFMACHSRYMEWRMAQPSEAAYRPLCLDRCNLAMTYETFLKRFKELMQETARALEGSTSPRVQGFLMNYRMYGVSPHICRHYFSVNLVLAGYDEIRIMTLRGDNSVNSAMTYLRNKGALMEQANATSELLTGWLREVAGNFKKG